MCHTGNGTTLEWNSGGAVTVGDVIDIGESEDTLEAIDDSVLGTPKTDGMVKCPADLGEPGTMAANLSITEANGVHIAADAFKLGARGTLTRTLQNGDTLAGPAFVSGRSLGSAENNVRMTYTITWQWEKLPVYTDTTPPPP